MNIIGTGLNGLIGSKLMEDFSGTYQFQNIDRLDEKQPIDITKPIEVLNFLNNSDAPFVVHFAAFTDVTKAWEQRDDLNGSAYQVNVIGTKNVVNAAEQTGKHLIHISTAYVFNGEKEGMYTEEDPVSPIEWYGQTKALAEEQVMKSAGDWTILRIDQPFRSDTFPKVDFAHRIIQGLIDDKLYPQFTDHFVGPTYIDDFVKVIDWIIRTGTTGVFHATSGEKWSDYAFAKMVNEELQLGKEVKSGELASYLKTLNRPYQKNTAMDSSKLISQLDFKLTSIKDAVKQIERSK